VLERFADGVLRFRWVVIGITFGLFFWFGYHASFAELDNTYRVFYRPDNPHLKAYRHLLEIFGGDEYLVIVAEHPEIFDRERLEFIHRIEEALEADPDVIETLSLVSIERTESEDEMLVSRPFIDPIPEDRDHLAALRQSALEDRFYQGQIVGPDGTAILISARLPELDMNVKMMVVRRLLAAVKAEAERYGQQPPSGAPLLAQLASHLQIPSEESAEDASMLRMTLQNPEEDYGIVLRDGTRLLLSGMPVLDAELNRLQMYDSLMLYPFILVFACITLYVLFRRPSAVVYPLVVVGSALATTMGVYVLRDHTLNLVTSVLPPLFIAAGIACSIHVINHYNEEIQHGRPKREAARQTILRMAAPCFFTALTTSIGFGSFSISDVPPIRDLGVYAALGLMLAFVFSIASIPAILSLLPAPRPAHVKARKEGPVSRLLAVTAEWVIRHYRAAFWGVGGLALLVSSGMVLLHVETQAMLFLKPDNLIRRATDIIEEKISGLASTDIIVEGPAGALKEPEILRKVDELQRIIESEYDVQKTVSLVNYIKEFNKLILSENRDEYEANYRIPDSREAVAQLMLLMEAGGGEEIYRYVDADFSRARISNRGPFRSSEMAKRNFDGIEARMAQLFADRPEIQLELTGVAKMWVMFDTLLLGTLMQSFGLAAFFISVCMILLLRSARIGLFSLIPNFIPIAMVWGLMGYTGINLDIATTMVAAVALSIAVDDTIHYLTRFKREFDACGSYAEAVRRSHAGVGHAIVATSVIIFVGCGVLVFGSFVPTVYFGLLVALAMAFALVGDLILLPAILMDWKPFGPEAEV
jgi:predicted RND superfamily exporter protein